MIELLMRRREMSKKRLPYDAEVEYIQTDGDAYIDTGVKVANTTTFNITIKFSSTPPSAFWLFGGRVAFGSGALTPYYESGKWHWRYGNQTPSGSSFSLATNTNYAISNVASSRVMKINNNYSITATANTFSNNNTIYLLGMNNNGTLVKAPSGLCCVGGELYTNGTKVREFIAVRVGQVGYLYDKVSGELFGNANSTGAFILGNDKN